MPLGMEVGLGSGDIVIDRDPAPPLQKGAELPTKFSAHMFILAKQLDGSRWYLAWR